MENITYTVLKKYGDYKKGDILDPVNDDIELSEADIAEAVEGKFIKANVPDEAPKEETAAESAGEAKEDTRTVVTATWNGGKREFSKAIHGEKFLEVAAEFCATHNGTFA